ncbi:MAG: MATE family efflux transporter [Lutibacter sp.]
MKLNRYTSEFKNNLKLATPIMLGSLGHLLVGLIDDIMVGRLGAVQLAATSLGNSLFFIAMSIGIGFSFAITPLIAESDGEKDIQKGRSYFQHGMLLLTVTGVVMFLFLLALKPILHHLDQPEEVVTLAIPYFEIVSVSMIPLMIFQGLKQFADGLSQTKYAMYATIITNVVNVMINFALIYGFWIFPRLELVGAALGTLISRIVMVIFLYLVLRNKQKFEPYMHLLKWVEIKRKVFNKIISLGFPTALQMLFEVGLFASSVLLAGTFGAFPQAANQIALKLSSTTFMVAVGIGVAATIRVGNQKGLKNFVELRRIAFSNFLLILGIMSLFSVGFMIFKNFLPHIFTENVEVITLASNLLIIAGLFQLFDGTQAVVLGGLRGLQDVKIPSVLTFIAYWLVGFPVCYFLSTIYNMGTLGIWLGLLTGLTTSALLLFLRFNYLSNKLIHINS